jgi:hypothetical protein
MTWRVSPEEDQELSTIVREFNQSLGEFNSVIEQYGREDLCVTEYLYIGRFDRETIVDNVCERFQQVSHVMTFFERDDESDIDVSLVPHYNRMKEIASEFC